MCKLGQARPRLDHETSGDVEVGFYTSLATDKFEGLENAESAVSLYDFQQTNQRFPVELSLVNRIRDHIQATGVTTAVLVTR
jgi:hypothetical protein